MVRPFGPDDPAEPDADRTLHWPAGFPPGCSDVWARSELAINAPPAVVFSCLVTAGRRLAWSGQGIDISTYHAWVISGDSRASRALAGFAARGAAAIALRETGPGAAQRALDRWAADLRTAAEGVRP